MNPLAFAALLLALPLRAESFQAWSARAARAEKRKDYRQALEDYSNALSSWQEGDGERARAQAYCARAALWERRGDNARALADYSTCLKTDRKNAKAFDRRGRLRLKLGEVQQAIGDFYKATAVKIDYGEAYADRARAYELSGDKKFAREDYRHACDLGVSAACAKLHPSKKKSGGSKPRAAAATAATVAACRDAATACADAGEALDACVAKLPSCSDASARGCCPSACKKDFRRALDEGHSAAEAFRGVFAGSRCVVPAPPEPTEKPK